MLELSTPIAIVTVGLFVSISVMVGIREVGRARRDDFEARLERRLREADDRLQAELRAADASREAQARERQSLPFVDHLSDHGGAWEAGDYVTLTLNKGPRLRPADFNDATLGAIRIQELLTSLAPGAEDIDLEVRVYRARYENPLELVFDVLGPAGAVAALAFLAVRINRAVEEVRLSWSHVAKTQAWDDASQAHADLEAAIFAALTEALDSSSPETRRAKLEAIAEVAHLAASENLVSITHRNVSALDSHGRTVRTLGSASAVRELPQARRSDGAADE